MELLTGDRHVPNATDFPQHLSPFPAAGNLIISSPTAVVQLLDGYSFPPQKLRPIRANGRSLSGCPADDPPFSGGMDGTLENFGEFFELPPVKVVARDVAVNGFRDTEAPALGVVGSCPHRDGDGGLLEVDSSSSSEEDSPPGIKECDSWKRKRKRREKLEGFMENLVMKVLEKQERMHKELIEAMERREQERMIREEAWIRQERERVKRDEEERVQEIARSLVLISFIQNVMGHKIEVPEPLTTMMPYVDKYGERNVCNIPSQNDFKCDPINKRWPVAEVQALITLRTASEQKFRAMGTKSSNIWDEISVGMRNMGYNRTAKKCKEKWENIKKYYRKSMESGGKKRHENSKTCPYFHELHMLYKNGFNYHGNANIGSEANCR